MTAPACSRRSHAALWPRSAITHPPRRPEQSCVDLGDNKVLLDTVVTRVSRGDSSALSTTAGTSLDEVGGADARRTAAPECGEAAGRAVTGKDEGQTPKLIITPHTELWFAHRKYRVVMCLDVSSSMKSIRLWGIPSDFLVEATMLYVRVRRGSAHGPRLCGVCRVVGATGCCPFDGSLQL